jgi:hypothetical protein
MASAGRYSRRSPAAHVLIATAVVVGVAGSPAKSQSITFEPQIHVSASYTDNAFLSSEDSDQERSDVYGTLGFTLPLSRELEHGSLGLAYSLNFNRFQDFDELDNLNQNLGFSFSTETSSTSSFNLGLGYSVSEDPFGSQDGQPVEVEGFDDPLFVVGRRLENQHAAANVGFSREFSPRGSVQFYAGYSTSRPDEIESDEDLGDVEDRDEIGGGLGVSRTLSEYASVALQYGIQGFDLDVSGQSLSHSLGVGWSRAVQERSSVSLQIGVFYRDRVVVMVNEDEPAVETDDVGIHGTFGYGKTFQRYALGLSASHQPSAGHVLVGTSTVSEVTFSLSPLYTERWFWSISLRYGHRDPDLVDQNPIDSFQGGVSVGRSLGRKLGFSLNGAFITQNENQANQYDVVAFRTSMSLVFHPLARSP